MIGDAWICKADVVRFTVILSLFSSGFLGRVIDLGVDCTVEEWEHIQGFFAGMVFNFFFLVFLVMINFESSRFAPRSFGRRKKGNEIEQKLLLLRYQ